MRIHILGICGTFMAGIAMLAREAGHAVSGSDSAAYPPMSTQLERAGIQVLQGYETQHLDPAVDQFVVGNVMRRGMPIVEALLDEGYAYISGPQWLAEQVLRERWVLAVAGTHGKTTTSAMVAWILDRAGLSPGFLIGGMPSDFGISARLGGGPVFVVEADEYDTAFFDKRAKFVHYRPRTLVLNNLEFDHADIFPSIEAIAAQFHHLLRTVPGSGRVVVNDTDAHLQTVLEQGCWTPIETFGRSGWTARVPRRASAKAIGSSFEVWLEGRCLGSIDWRLSGEHNAANALAAIAAARHAGVPPNEAIQALGCFSGVRRRMELRGRVRGVSVYDDFAHHPTAVAATLEAARALGEGGRLLAVLEPRSNTMRMGHHQQALVHSLRGADKAYLLDPGDMSWSLRQAVAPLGPMASVYHRVASIVDQVCREARTGDCVLVMSNGSFGGIHERLLASLADSEAHPGALS